MHVLACPYDGDAVQVVDLRRAGGGHPLVTCPTCGRRFELVGTRLVELPPGEEC
ncbi:hypothetical protein [Goekera deserti]|uniref:Uncharacterized protein n=1 Tax=Goekera deserti TaxID=2497753 RepID=A0A7K3W9L4_9ACTN|nr:hypothetical protein [Goekera deserti]NDI50003.1 hypothetical protein [Goekera deserti]NEL52520.1 hypothetical protein [Goekera deserti]